MTYKMENSNAYQYIMKQMSAVGREKLDGYDARAFDDLTDEEKDKLEAIIWRKIVLGTDNELAVYLPKLRKHDGISALRKKLNKEKNTENKVFYADILYRSTKDEQCFKVFRECCKVEKGMHRVAVALQDYPKAPETEELLKEVFVQSESEPTQITALIGVFHQEGYLQSAHNLKKEELLFCKSFCVKDAAERKNRMEGFLAGMVGNGSTGV